MEIDKTYKLTNNPGMAVEYRGRKFTLVKKDSERVYIQLEGDDHIRNFSILKWNDYVLREGPSWQGNKLLFKFI